MYSEINCYVFISTYDNGTQSEVNVVKCKFALQGLLIIFFGIWFLDLLWCSQNIVNYIFS